MSPTDSQPKSKPTSASAATVGGNNTFRSPIRVLQDVVQDTTTLARLFVETLLSPLLDPNSWTSGPTLSNAASGGGSSWSSGSGSGSGSGGNRLGGGGGGGGSWFGGGSSGGGGNGGGGGGRRLGTIAGLNGSGSEFLLPTCFVRYPHEMCPFVWHRTLFDNKERCVAGEP